MVYTKTETSARRTFLSFWISSNVAGFLCFYLFVVQIKFLDFFFVNKEFMFICVLNIKILTDLFFNCGNNSLNGSSVNLLRRNVDIKN